MTRVIHAEGGARRPGNSIRKLAAGRPINNTRAGLVVAGHYHLDSIIKPLIESTSENFDREVGESPITSKARTSQIVGWQSTEG